MTLITLFLKGEGSLEQGWICRYIGSGTTRREGLIHVEHRNSSEYRIYEINIDFTELRESGGDSPARP